MLKTKLRDPHVETILPVTPLTPLLYRQKGSNFEQSYKAQFPDDEPMAHVMETATYHYGNQLTRLLALRHLNEIFWKKLQDGKLVKDMSQRLLTDDAFEFLSHLKQVVDNLPNQLGKKERLDGPDSAPLSDEELDEYLQKRFNRLFTDTQVPGHEYWKVYDGTPLPGFRHQPEDTDVDS